MLYRYIFPYGGLFIIKLISFTYRVRILDLKNEKEILDSKTGLIYASWHQRFFPTITSSQNKWIFNSWDKFMIPKPFSRVIIRLGNAIHVPGQMEPDEFEAKRLDVENQMKALYQDTDLLWSNPSKIKEIFK